MTKELNYTKLKRELIKLLERYLKNPKNQKNREKLSKLWKYYFNTFPFIEKTFKEALNIGEDFLCYEEPLRIKVQKIIKELKNTKY